MNPPFWPNPDELDENPELAVLAALDAVLRNARSALLAAHVELRSGNGIEDELPPLPAVWLAHAAIADADSMLKSIERYRAALHVSALSSLRRTLTRDF